jgi:peptidoglycan hydrolase CwlO-like protein
LESEKVTLIEEAQAAAVDYLSQISTLETTRDGLESQIASLEGQVAGLQSDKDGLIGDNTALTNEVSDLEA